MPDSEIEPLLPRSQTPSPTYDSTATNTQTADAQMNANPPPPSPAVDIEVTFWFVWMGALLVYTTFSAIVGSVKWFLVSCIASDVFTVLSALLWIFVAIDFALNMHWMIDETKAYDERKEQCKIYSRFIRIPLVWFVLNLLLPLKAFDTFPSNQQLWNNQNNISVSLDTSLFFASCIVYLTITVLLCLLLGWKLCLVEPHGTICTLTSIAIVCYCILIFGENILRNALMFNWFSQTSNSMQPLWTGLFIPVSAGMMLFPFVIVEGLHIEKGNRSTSINLFSNCLIERAARHLHVGSTTLILLFALLFTLFCIVLFYLTVGCTMLMYHAYSILLFTLSLVITIVTVISSCSIHIISTYSHFLSFL